MAIRISNTGERLCYTDTVHGASFFVTFEFKDFQRNISDAFSRTFLR